MALTCVMAVLVLVVSAEGHVGPSTNSSFCTESKECLEYELVCKTDEYEVRHYTPTRWVSTDAEAYFMGVGAAMAFRRLFQYITGDNEGGFQMDMTAPVLVKIPEETRMWEPAVYTLSFPLPAAYQDKPPQPNNDKLYFTDMPEMDVYVRSYGGWMLSVTARLHAHLLTKELERVRALYNCTYHYGVGYDSPLKLLNRHNEVWYVSEGKPVCSDPQEPTPPHPTRLRSDPHSDEDDNDDNPTTDLPAHGPSTPDPSSPLPESPSPTADSNSTTSSNSSQAPPTSAPLSQATPSSPSTPQPTDAAPSQAPTSTHATAPEQTHVPSNSSDSVGPSVDPHSTPAVPEEPTQDGQ